MVNYRRWLVKEEEGHPSSAVSNQSCWPQVITRGCAPFLPDIMNCHFHLSPDHNTEFYKRPKRWTAMGNVGRFRHPRFNEVHPHEQRFRKKKILVKCRSWTITRLFKVFTCHLAWRTLWKEFRTDYKGVYLPDKAETARKRPRIQPSVLPLHCLGYSPSGERGEKGVPPS